MPLGIEIFKAGRHTDSRGRTIEFTPAMLAAIAAAYSVDLHEAPIVLGHPKDNAPAYGWVKGLGASEGGGLQADADQLDPAFTEAVRAGRYKKVSASFYHPDSASNPTPGQYYLRHVGFLGAQPPAVKGLAPVSFADDGDDVVTIDFADELDVARLLRSLREWLIGQFGQEEAEKALPGWYVDHLQEQGAVDVATQREEQPAYSEQDGAASNQPAPESGKVLEKEKAPAVAPTAADPAAAGANISATEFAERERRLAEREVELARREREAGRKAHGAFLDGLVQAGKPLPLERERVLDLCEVLEHGDGAVSFAEGESPIGLFKKLLESLPKQVDFVERSATTGTDDELDAEAIGRAALEFVEEQRSRGITVTATDAVRHVKTTKGLLTT
jgi:hypothetical protein